MFYFIMQYHPVRKTDQNCHCHKVYQSAHSELPGPITVADLGFCEEGTMQEKPSAPLVPPFRIFTLHLFFYFLSLSIPYSFLFFRLSTFSLLFLTSALSWPSPLLAPLSALHKSSWGAL